MPIRKDKPRKCKNPECEKVFIPTYSTVQPVCSYQCSIAYNKIVAKKTEDVKWQKEKKIIKAKLETKSEVEKKFEKEVNRIVRILDRGQNCISSGRPLGN